MTQMMVSSSASEHQVMSVREHVVALVGLAAVDTSGVAIGVVTEVLHNTGQELLVVRRASGDDVLVPFAIFSAVSQRVSYPWCWASSP